MTDDEQAEYLEAKMQHLTQLTNWRALVLPNFVTGAIDVYEYDTNEPTEQDLFYRAFSPAVGRVFCLTGAGDLLTAMYDFVGVA